MSVQTLYTAATGMESMQTKLDVIANNLANSNTTAFKRDRVNFEDLLYRHQVYPGLQDSAQVPTPTGVEVGLGTRASKARKRTTSKVRSNKQDAISTLRSKAKVSSKSLTTKRKARCTHAAEISISTPTDNWSSVQPRQVDFSIHRSPSLKVRPPSSSTPTGP